MDYVNQRIKGDAVIAPEVKTEEYMSGALYYKESRTGVMNIDGPLTYKSSGWEAFCGGTSYEMLKEQMVELVESGAKTVAWICDSGGGEAFGMMDTANYLRKLADENDIQIIAFVEGMSASACYGLACVADEIVMTKDSQVGSIGVLIQLMNNSKALEKAGYERTFITAGKDKVPFDKDGAFTEAFTTRLQDQVNALYDEFTSHVATHRELSVDAVKGTEANVFLSADAVSLGLADKVMTVEEFYEYLAETAQTNGGSMRNPLERILTQTTKTQIEDTTEMAKLEEIQALLDTATGKLEASNTELATIKAAYEKQAADLTAAKAALDAIDQAAAVAEVEARRTKLSAVLPADKVEANLAALTALDGAAFNIVVAGLQAGKDAAMASESAQELGEEGAELEDKTVDAQAAHDAITAAAIARIKAQRA
jgi:ClpP class serine protease